MARRKNKKKKRKYNQQQFIAVICSKCTLCENGTEMPVFCYRKLYKGNPELFVKKVFKALFESNARNGWLSTNVSTEDGFSQMICASGVCFHGNAASAAACGRKAACYRAFKAQTEATSPTTTAAARIKRKAKRKKRSKWVVREPYPTFFSNGNPDFLKKIEEILDADRNIQPDNSERTATENTPESGATAEDTKPEAQGGET